MQYSVLKAALGSATWSLLVLTLVGVANAQSEIAQNASTVVQHNDQPIVVQTPLQNYELPTLNEYEECQNNRKQCEDVCAGNEKCLKECPLCPELYVQAHVVQGINDTDARPALLAVPVNATHVIRLTNEINNIIDNNIHTRNTNNIQVHQNVSHVGGRFGLGYNEHGSCCFVIQRPRHCDGKQHCVDQKRHRVCGERCQARVMLAKRVIDCDANDPDNCHEKIEYVPARKRMISHHPHDLPTPEQSRCRYLGNYWPYVSCNGDQQNTRNKRYTETCQRCLELPYGYILHNGLPANCVSCFSGYAGQMMPMWYAPMAAGYNVPMYNHISNNDYWNEPAEKPEQSKPVPDEDSGWILEKQQCMQPNGEWADCDQDNDSGSGSGPLIKPVKPKPQPGDANEYNNVPNFDYEYTDDGYNVPAQRHRRRRHFGHKFQRSIYSHRTD